MTKIKEQVERLMRGTVEIFTEAELAGKLAPRRQRRADSFV